MENAAKFKIDASVLSQLFGHVDQGIELVRVESIDAEEARIINVASEVSGLVVVAREKAKSDPMIVEIHCANETIFDCNPENIDVKTVAVEASSDMKTLTCDVYAKCDVHCTVPSSGGWVEKVDREPSEEATKLSTVECVENVNTSRGLATVETHVVNEFKVLRAKSLLVVSQTTCSESAEESTEQTGDGVGEESAACDFITESSEGTVEFDSVGSGWQSRVARSETPTIGCDDVGMKEVHVAVEIRPEERDVIEALGECPDFLKRPPIYGCSQCKYRSADISVMREHLKTENGAQLRYPCDDCCKVFTSVGNLSRHKMVSHDKLKPFSCPHCQKSFGQKAHLQRHLSEQNSQLQCKYCFFATEYRCAMAKHHKESHPSKPQVKYESSGSIVWQCGVCEYECVSKRDLAQHMKHHTSRTPLNYKCDSCSFVTDYPCRLKRHILSHTQERPYRCGICEYRGTQIEHVVRHMRTMHHTEPKHTLDSDEEPKVTTILPACPNTDELRKTGLLYDLPSNDRGSLSRDIDHHKLFACTLCDIGFQRPRNLQKHLDDVHGEEENRYLCSVCRNQSDNAEHFLEHLASHKPPSTPVEYMCSYCNFKTEKRRNFVYHMQAKHYKIVHFGSRNSSYGVSDLYPDLMLGPHDVVMTTVYESRESNDSNFETPLSAETIDPESSCASSNSQEEVLQVNEGDLIQIDDVIYRIEPSH